MDNHDMKGLQWAFPTIQRLAAEAGTAPDAAEQAIRGAQALLPGEILREDAEQSTLWLDLAIASRSTFDNDDGTLTWNRGMEEIGHDLLILAGCPPQVRTQALRQTRAALVSRPRTELERRLLNLLESAAAIVTGNHVVLSKRLITLLQWTPNCKIVPWQPTSGASIRSGSAEVVVLPDLHGEIAAVELRLYHSNGVDFWRLPAIFGETLVVQLGKRNSQRHQP